MMRAMALLLLNICGTCSGYAVAAQKPAHSQITAGQQPEGSDRSYWRRLSVNHPDPLVAAANDAMLDASPLTPGGPYGLAQRPSMGWRSWNAYHNDVTQAKIEAVMDAMVAKQSGGRSILELGYSSVGLDDAWQACGQGFNGTFHAVDGTPLWNNVTFPDPSGMVAKAHSLQLKAGWCESSRLMLTIPASPRVVRHCAVADYAAYRAAIAVPSLRLEQLPLP